MAGARAVVHLAGEPVFGGLPTPRDASACSREPRRIDANARWRRSARLAAADRPKVLVCASAVGYYGDRGEDTLEEDAAPGAGFLADTCVAWEAEAARAESHGLRRVSLRFGIVLARAGGALATDGAALPPRPRRAARLRTAVAPVGGRSGRRRSRAARARRRRAARAGERGRARARAQRGLHAHARAGRAQAGLPARCPRSLCGSRSEISRASCSAASAWSLPARPRPGYAFAQPALRGALEAELAR